MTRNRTSNIIRVIVVILAILIVVGYAIFNSRLFIEGPIITITSPENGSLVTESSLVKIEGTALNIAFLNMNDRQIYTEEDGQFSESLLLHSGYNIIQFTAEDKFGRSITESLELVYTGPKPAPILDEIDIDESSSNEDANNEATTTDATSTSL